MATCMLCNTNPPDGDAMDHMRLFHPDVFADIEQWPDGRYVIHDTTLGPDDFRQDG